MASTSFPCIGILSPSEYLDTNAQMLNQDQLSVIEKELKALDERVVLETVKRSSMDAGVPLMLRDKLKVQGSSGGKTF